MRFTRKELDIMRVLYENVGVEYLARDAELGLHGYIGKNPQKTGKVWDNNNGWRIGISGIDSIKWEDKEPVCLSDIFEVPDTNKIPSSLGGDGNYAKMLENLHEVFKYNKELREFLIDASLSVAYNGLRAFEIRLNGGWGRCMFITSKGISWNDGSGQGTKLIVPIEELLEYM